MQRDDVQARHPQVFMPRGQGQRSAPRVGVGRLSTILYEDGELVGLRNAIVRTLALEPGLVQEVLKSVGEANRESYLQAYRENHDVSFVPPGPIDWTAPPRPCWMAGIGWPRETWNLDGTVTIEHFTLEHWIGNLLYNTNNDAEGVGWLEAWMNEPQCSLVGSANHEPVTRKPRRRTRGKPGSWTGVPKTRTHVIRGNDGERVIRLPGEITGAFPSGSQCRYTLPGGWFISDEGERAKRWKVPRYTLHLSGAHKSGCAEPFESSNQLKVVMDAWRRRVQALVPA